MPKQKVFNVEMETMACRCCRQGGRWIVVGPDEVATGVSYGCKEDAEEQAQDLNYAFELGKKYARKKKG
jgi:hypothetical protein